MEQVTKETNTRSPEHLTNIRRAIRMLQRVKRNEKLLDRKLLEMDNFQFSSGEDLFRIMHTEEDLLKSCGTQACFAGFVAITPEFTKQGVFEVEGIPHMKSSVAGSSSNGMLATFGYLFGFNAFETDQICAMGRYHDNGEAWNPDGTREGHCPKSCDDVIERLRKYLPNRR